MFSLPLAAQQGGSPPTPPQAAPTPAEAVDALFVQLLQPGVDSSAVEAQIMDLWSRSGSASIDLLMQRGNEAMEAQDYDSAIGFFTALIDHAPGFAQGYSARAVAWYSAGLAGPALADIQSALALEPRHIEAMSGLAVILEDVGTPEEALEAWKLLARLTPHDETVKEALGRLDSGPRGSRL